MKRNRSYNPLTACCLMLLAATLPAQAHTTQAPPNPALDAATDTSISVVTVVLLGVAAYYGFRALAAYVEKRRGAALDDRTTQGGVLLATAGTVLLLWRLAAPHPVAVAASTHTDTPQHGGQIQAVGNSHVEAAVRPDGAVAVYLMGVTETLTAPITQKTLWAEARAGAAQAAVMLHASPLPGDPAGQASAFVGQLPPAVAGKPVTISVTLPLDGVDQPVRFALGPMGAAGVVPAHDTAPTMVVAARPTTAEQRLFLTPGGAYTQADVAANGDTTPDIKYAGQMANHHLNPRKGTYTCPITKTQANVKFPWTVGGRKYLFCCPPCISEFVKEAKAEPKGLRPPETYIQR